MPKEYEYHKGKRAQRAFEECMKVLLQVPKDTVRGSKNPPFGGFGFDVREIASCESLASA